MSEEILSVALLACGISRVYAVGYVFLYGMTECIIFFFDIAHRYGWKAPLKSFLEKYGSAAIMDPMDPVQLDIGRNISMPGVIALVYPTLNDQALSDGTASRTMRNGTV
jgi:hypothetical protein